MFDLQPTQKRKKTTTKERNCTQDSGDQDSMPKEYVMAWRGVSKAFHITGNHMRHAIPESKAREISPIRKVCLTTTDKNIANLFDGVSLKVMPDGRIRVVTKDESKAVLIKNFSLQLMHNGKIRVIAKEE